MQTDKPLNTANVEWNQDTPVSTRFGDMYFNIQAGLDESRHVFLDGNNLASRFAQLNRDSFTIAETGFGTGLNFLAARLLWLKHAPADARLHFISVERFPLSKEDLERALEHWPDLADGSRQLIAHYPTLVPGFHQLIMDGGRVRLTLMLMDAIDAYSALDASVDAWFLDGFAPSKNPEMWNDTLFTQMGRLSHPGTTLATFTAAGFVRRGLQAVGFEVRKATGFGRKREMVCANFMGPAPLNDSPSPWFGRPAQAAQTAQVIIIGAGIAGCSTAYALAQRGIPVRLLEQHDQIAQEGSGNHQGALYAKLPVSHNPQGQLHLSGLLFSNRLLHTLDPEQKDWNSCGLLQLATTAKERQRQLSMLEATHLPTEVITGVDAEQASVLAGVNIEAEGLYMPAGGWVSPRQLCERLLDHPLIELSLNIGVERIEQSGQGTGWTLTLNDGATLQAPQLVLCNADRAKTFSPTAHLPVKPIRGQTTVSPAEGPTLKRVVCADGYISPAMDGHYCFGATFDLHDRSTEVRDSDHAKNLEKLRATLPTLAGALNPTDFVGKVAYRCSTADYMPIAGAAPDADAFIEDYAKLRVDRRWRFTDQPPRHLTGLYLNIGHGSKGLITAPLCAELVAALIAGDPLPVERELADAVNPARFIIKNLIRKSI